MIALIIPLPELGSGYPSQGLPGGPPVYPGQGLPGGGFPGQGYPGQGLPGGPGHHPGQPLPPFPGLPGQDLPNFPGLPGQPLPPGGIAGQPLPPLPTVPGNQPGQPALPIALPPQHGTLPIFPATPGNPLPIPPGVIWPPLGPNAPQGKAIALVAISGVGYRWTVIDTSLSVGWPLPPSPPAAQPK
jgi:hypothetical protein